MTDRKRNQSTEVTTEQGTYTPNKTSAVDVWACGQRARATQRGNRYASGSDTHPAPTVPDLARYVIARYTRPGEWVLDPMCGIGTTVIEAITRGRHALGIDIDPRWTEITHASLDTLRRHGFSGEAHVVTGDARQVDTLLPPALKGQVALLFCAPPYGPVHTPPETQNGAEGAWQPGPPPLDRHRLRATLTEILRGCTDWLRPGGHAVLTIRPWRTPGGELLDLPADVLAAGQRAGLVPRERCAAVLARLTPHGVHARASSTHRVNIARLRAGGQPAVMQTHHDVFIFTAPDQPQHQPALPSALETAAGRRAA